MKRGIARPFVAEELAGTAASLKGERARETLYNNDD